MEHKCAKAPHATSLSNEGTRDPAARKFAKYSMPKGNSMAFKPNYGLQRADRNRAAQARSEEKKRKREEKSAHRKAERIVEIKSLPHDERRQNKERSMGSVLFCS
jgi:hypothetical protein